MTAHLRSVEPVLPVRDLDAAQAHYAALGFTVHAHGQGTRYGFAQRGDVGLHMVEVEGHDPKTTASAIYLYVDDADALYAEWNEAGVPGRLAAPEDTDYGLREGAHVDPDGNLLRFGSSLPATS